MVERLVRDQEVAGSSPVSPIQFLMDAAIFLIAVHFFNLQRSLHMKKKNPPEYTATFRKKLVKVPPIIREKTSGITIIGKTIYSILFSTDVAIIKNSNADAVIAVYPFTPHPAVTQAIMSIADVPVLCGVGGGITNGLRSANIALHAEFQGALAVVLNAPANLQTISAVKETIDIPVIITIVSENIDIKEKLNAGADILNISGGINTPKIVSTIRKKFSDIPIIATGGTTDESILKTIRAGANAISFTPLSSAELFKELMENYRHEL